MSDKASKTLISIRAFEGRMKRHLLSKNNKAMKKCRADSRGYEALGPYYLVDTHHNNIGDRGISLDALIDRAREAGVLKPYEDVEQPI